MKIYFDNAATTPVHPKVREVINTALDENFGNPSSVHYFGRKAKVLLEESREVIADFINASPSEIYFTSGGTEADNFAIMGIAKADYIECGRGKIITNSAEHHAVLDSLDNLSQEGFDVEIIGADKNFKADLSETAKRLNKNTSLISVMHTNNETGTVNNIKGFSDAAKKHKTYFHSDMVQCFGKTPIDVREVNIDSICASSHKIYGPKGIGFVYFKSGTPVKPIIFGGSQERNRRGGTENLPAIAGFAEAVRIAKTEMLDNFNRVSEIKNYFIGCISSINEGDMQINSAEDFSPYILSVTFNGKIYNNDPEAYLMYLDINGIAVSNGAACTSGTWKPSHVLLSAGRSIEDAKGTIRFSFSPWNNRSEVDYAVDVIKKMREKFRK